MTTRRAVRAPRRPRFWMNNNVDLSVLGIGMQIQDLLAGFDATYGMIPTDFTVVRVLADLLMLKTANSLGDAGPGMGIIIVSDDAFAAGQASVPHPVSDADADWMFVSRVGFASRTEDHASGSGWTRLHWDLSGQRILRKANKALTLCFEGDRAGNNYELHGLIRVLLLGR